MSSLSTARFLFVALGVLGVAACSSAAVEDEATKVVVDDDDVATACVRGRPTCGVGGTSSGGTNPPPGGGVYDPNPPSASPLTCTDVCWAEAGGCKCMWGNWIPAGWSPLSSMTCSHSFPVPRLVNGVWRCYAW